MGNIEELSKTFVVDLLKSLYDKWYYFHNLQHTLDVYERVGYLAEKSKLSKKECEWLRLASLFHDTGFIFRYDDNEYYGAKIAERFLVHNNYPKIWINKVKKLIMATVVWYQPKNLLEWVVKDADLDNLWRNDFPYRLSVLREEIKAIKWVEFSDKEWFGIVYNFIRSTSFYSDIQKYERNELLIRNIEIMKDRVDRFS